MSRDSGFAVHREVYQSPLNLPEDADLPHYRAMSGLAILGLLIGLLSLSGLVVPLLWALAVVGIVVNGKALARIKAVAPALLGRNVALAGLFLSIFAACAAPADWIVYRRLMRQEARQFAETWFEYLRGNETYKAHQLTVPPSDRLPLDETLRESYGPGSEGRPYLQKYFLRSPELRTVAALGDNAKVRYYATESQSSGQDSAEVYQTYAVTFPDSDGLKSFFIGLKLQRSVDKSTGRAYWQMRSSYGGVRPRHLGGDGRPPKG